MTRISMVFGILLCALGVGGYFVTDRISATALFPLLCGVPLLVLGFLGEKPGWRANAMHTAAVIALLGALGPWARLRRDVPHWLHQGFDPSRPQIAMLLMSFTCLVFVALAVASFVRTRRKNAAELSL